MGRHSMRTRGGFGGLDVFRMAAAFLVVAIHTSPLATYSGTADFLLTRVAARVAVPFFFMVTGYFTFSPEEEHPGQAVRRRIGKTLGLYAGCIVLYVPLGIYAGHYEGMTVWEALRLLVFDGTFYHLWYLPAMALGLGIVYALGSLLSMRATGIVTLVLYVIGLGGDSYYGLISQSAVLKGAYDACFHVFSYTRNGLFFAPLFLFLGAWMADMPRDRGRRSGSGQEAGRAGTAGWLIFGAALALMAAEGLLLHQVKWQRHDSMYLMLPICMIALFGLLIWLPVKARPGLRPLSTAVYILHPMMIVAVRVIGRLTGWQAILVENSLGHYVAVCMATLAGSLVICKAAGYAKQHFLLKIPAQPAGHLRKH